MKLPLILIGLSVVLAGCKVGDNKPESRPCLRGHDSHAFSLLFTAFVCDEYATEQ